MSDSLRDTYIQAAALHRERLSQIRPPDRKADTIARGFTDWLSLSQFLHFVELSVPGMKEAKDSAQFRSVDKQRDFERFRHIDPRSVRRARVRAFPTGGLQMRAFDSSLRGVFAVDFDDLAEWAEAREALDDYRPLMEFEAIEMLLRRQIELDLLQELGFSIPDPT